MGLGLDAALQHVCGVVAVVVGHVAVARLWVRVRVRVRAGVRVGVRGRVTG